MALAVIAPQIATAQAVVLKSKTGNVRIDGTLVEYDGEYFRVKTDLGVLTVDARTVDCTGQGCPEAQDMVARIMVSGPGDLGQTLLPTLLEAYSLSLGGEISISELSPTGQTQNITDSTGQDVAEISISVQPETDGFADLAKGGNRIVAASRLPTNTENKAVKTAGFGDLNDAAQQQILAVDGIVAVVSPSNPLNTISLAKLRQILSGKITNWRDVGGPDAAIDLYLPKADNTFGEVVQASLLGLKPAQMSKDAQRFGTLAKVADAAASNPFALGLTRFSNLRNAVPLGIKRPCGIYAVPSVFTLKSGGYPLTFNHYLFRPKLRLPVFAREFLDFAKSEQAQNVIRSLGFADLGISALSLDQQGLRLANAIGQAGKQVPLGTLKEMVKLQNGGQRLSTTFRFLPGSKTLDAQSQQNATLLASGLILGNYADKKIHLMGFTDSAGRSTQNIKLAKQSAKTVLQALIAAAPDGSLDDVEFVTSGFGEASPLACENAEAGKQVNRRVEIWIKDR